MRNQQLSHLDLESAMLNLLWPLKFGLKGLSKLHSQLTHLLCKNFNQRCWKLDHWSRQPLLLITIDVGFKAHDWAHTACPCCLKPHIVSSGVVPRADSSLWILDCSGQFDFLALDCLSIFQFQRWLAFGNLVLRWRFDASGHRSRKSSSCLQRSDCSSQDSSVLRDDLLIFSCDPWSEWTD